MVRSYLRHGETAAFGLIASSSSVSVFDGALAFVPALEDVLVWDVKKGEQAAMWHETGHRALVTCMARHTDGERFAVGYADGSIRLWSAYTKSVLITFDGHRKAITSLAFDASGTRLASGSQDTDVIVWDVLAEAGMFRLRGHRDQITSLHLLSPSADSNEATHLISTSKEGLLKLWHLPTQHCLDTAVAHRTECWTSAIIPQAADSEEVILLTGGSEGELRLFSLTLSSPSLATEQPDASTSTAPATGKRSIVPLGPVTLSSTTHNQRISLISVHPSLPLLAIQTSERHVEVCRIRSEEDVRRKAKRRERREREKASTKGSTIATTTNPTDEDDGRISWTDRIGSWQLLNAGAKIRSFAFATGLAPVNRKARRKGKSIETSGELSILLALSNNSVETWSLPSPEASKEIVAATPPARLHAIRMQGHRTDVRALAVSSDDQLVVSASNGEVKIWNRRTGRCLRTMETGYALCCQWLPGDKHVLVGTKDGNVELFDVAASSSMETIKAHTAAVWSLHIRPDGKGFVTGSADKDIKFFDFEVRETAAEQGEDGEPRPPTRVLTATHVRTLKMTDDVLSVKYSPDGRLLAVALLDSTVKVFFSDTLKFFLSLYGHKLPVLSMDISFDSKLIVTCSADKNVKIWGLDFGDCHRSLFAHDDSVMSVAFEADSHHFWSVGKDKLVKYWDGDKFVQIQRITGHQAEVWALAVSHKGKFVVSGSADKSIRIIEKTDEPLFLEEERERELEALLDAEQPNNEQFDLTARETGEQPETGAVSKTTAETLTAGERIMEALALSDADRAAFAEPAVSRPARAPQLAASGDPAELYVLKMVQRIPPATLQDALLVLSFSQVGSLLYHLDHWIQKRWHISLTCRILFVILRVHYAQLIAARGLRDLLIEMRVHLREAMHEQKGTIGYNLAALQFIKRQHDAKRTAEFYEKPGNIELTEEEVRAKLAEGGKKRKRAVVK